MEKFRDMLHDFTDVLLAIGIAVVMLAVVVLNLGNWFDFGTVALASANPPVEVEVPIVAEVDEDTDVDHNETEEEKEEEKEEEEEVVADASNNDSRTNESTSAPITIEEIKRITIPNGTTGAGIARILKENRLIDEASEFIKTAEDLKLASRLKSGTFDIPTTATVEEMVRIISK